SSPMSQRDTARKVASATTASSTRLSAPTSTTAAVGSTSRSTDPIRANSTNRPSSTKVVPSPRQMGHAQGDDHCRLLDKMVGGSTPIHPVIVVVFITVLLSFWANVGYRDTPGRKMSDGCPPVVRLKLVYGR